MDSQTAPNAVQIELVEGCNLYCDFCGLRGIRTGPNKGLQFMGLSTLIKICDDIRKAKWNSRLEFAMHGEPTLHPQLVYFMQTVRTMLPTHYIMLTTNGGGLLPDARKSVDLLFSAGVNTIALDCYKYVTISDKIRFQLAGVPSHEYPADKTASPHTRHDGRKFVYVADISSSTTGTHARLNTHCGAASPPDTSMWGKRCAKPFREMSFRWDGNVALCCEDWRGVYKCGSIHLSGITSIWNSEPFRAARKFLYRGDRGNIPTCATCNQRSYRVGLLPDPLGKETLEEPTTLDLDQVKYACQGEPWTKPVLRVWEEPSDS
jgi:hypothetical protein